MKHIIFYSGGVGSWYSAKRVIEKEGKENVILLFTDTLIEDEDLYRFIDETVEKFGVEIVKIADGRSPWDIFEQEKFIGNSRVANCSKYLKQKAADKYIKENFKPEECILYLGIDWTEEHRTKAPIANWHPYEVRFPMCEEPYVTKDEMLEELNNLDIEIPRLYKLGFAHNNCGGFCVRAGQGHFINLLKTMPERYKHHEDKEQELIKLCKDHHGEEREFSILRRQKDKKKYRLTLKQLREEWESENQTEIDFDDIGGCGCFVTEDDKE